MHQVACFGEILWDNFPTGRKPGGAPMNVALNLNKLRVKSEIISSVGEDQDGEDLASFLLQCGLTTQYIQHHKTLPTGFVDVILDKNKQATYNIVKPVAWDKIQYTQSLTDLISSSDALVFGSLACRNKTSHQTLLKLLPECKLAIFDMNLRPPHFEINLLEDLMNKCHILKINEHELEYLEQRYSLKKATTETQIKTISNLTNTAIIVLTLGDKGASILHQGTIYNHPGFPVRVTDTVGAGDAFLAAFISGYLRKLPMQKTLTLACATGALVASRTGANPDYSIDEILKISNI